MKRPFLPIAIGLLLLLTPSLAIAFAGDDPDFTPLNNKDVLTMVQKHLSEDTIVKAIKSSPCTFDTFPPVLQDMKRRGVPDAVLQAMVEAPYGPSSNNLKQDELGDHPIYHYAEQLKALGYIIPSKVGSTSFQRQNVRASRTRRQ